MQILIVSLVLRFRFALPKNRDKGKGEGKGDNMEPLDFFNSEPRGKKRGVLVEVR